MIGKGATPSFFAIANDNYTLTYACHIIPFENVGMDKLSPPFVCLCEIYPNRTLKSVAI